VDARRLIPVGAAVTALLVLAGIASHGRPLHRGSGAGPSAVFFDYAATSMLLVGAGLVVLFLYLVRANATGMPVQRGRWHLLSSLVAFAGAILVAELIFHSHFEDRLRSFLQQHPQKPGQGQVSQNAGRNAHGRNAQVRWDEVAVVLVLVGGIAAYFLVTRARQKPRTPLRERRRRAVSRALDESLDDLRSDPDVRRAIIAAYARMENALAAAGLARTPAEAPFEYLERTLLELEASADAARRLTDLFERAKFSQHEPAEAMRDEAIDALIAVRDELREER
jgi:uncharacterized protein DUF4129